MTIYAHSGHKADRSDWETLDDHQARVAALAALAVRFGAASGVAKASALAARLHDLGKHAPAFQRRLAGEAVRVDHSTAGAALILREAEHFARESGDGTALLAAQLVAHAIAGHPAGLPDTDEGEAASLIVVPCAGAWVETSRPI